MKYKDDFSADAVAADAPKGPYRPPINPILLRMREHLLTLVQLELQAMARGDDDVNVDVLENYICSLRSAGLTDAEMEWVAYIPTDSLPGFSHPS